MLVAGLLAASVVIQGDSRPNGNPAKTAPRAIAVRAAEPPAIDGLDADQVWARATAITDFVEFEPNEGKDPRFRTEAKVAYDHRNFYIFVRAYDDEPALIKADLARRDVRPPTDQIKILIDSYFDRRSGFEFAVSPGGVKRDYLMYNDGNEDSAWDGVWDVSTTIDSLGWTAEFRIPLSQLRYTSKDTHTFGFGIWRDIERHKERVSWPLYKRQQAGLSSQLGELHGITGLSSPRRFEAAPYVVTRNVTLPDGPDFRHETQFRGGADFKYGVTSNLTLDGTINPDFGQVEADPSVLNLGAFETFFQERRPFFLEGVGLFQFRVNCYAVNDCGRENLFYSRRIGRAPQLGQVYGDETSATATTIIGAGKLTGRLPNGLSIGVMDAVTRQEEGVDGRTIEPTTNYGVIRAQKDFRDGHTSVGLIGTFVNRNLDQWTESSLRSSATVGGLDFRHRFLSGNYEVGAKVVGSHVGGSAEAIAATQTSNVHSYQRPDGPLDFDPTRTSLGGDFEQITFGKVGGSMLRFETSFQRTSPGFEINDLGFLNRADKQTQATWAQLSFNTPTKVYRRLFWNMNQANEWTAAGLPLDRMINTNVHTELQNSFWLHGGITIGGLGEVFCDRCARGGPALRTNGVISSWGGVEGDYRKAITPSLWFNYWQGDEARSHFFAIDPYLQFRLSSRLTASTGLSFQWNRDDRQWFDNITDDQGVVHHTFAHLEQETRSLTARIDFTATPTITLQVYASPFITKGQYTNLRELNDPRAVDYDDRFRPYTAIDPGGFNFKEFRSNVVARWEYRPGSALYLVWQQGRSHFENERGIRTFRGDLNELFDVHPNNTFLIKMSYWFDR